MTLSLHLTVEQIFRPVWQFRTGLPGQSTHEGHSQEGGDFCEFVRV